MFIDKNEKRINIHAPHTDEDGVRHPNMLDPAVRERLGIVEIADPVAPDDYSDDLYYRTEQDDAPYVVFTRKPQEMIDATLLARAKASRAAAFREEADPLFFQQQRGEVPAGTWEAKVAEIRDRYPDQTVS